MFSRGAARAGPRLHEATGAFSLTRVTGAVCWAAGHAQTDTVQYAAGACTPSRRCRRGPLSRRLAQRMGAGLGPLSLLSHRYPIAPVEDLHHGSLSRLSSSVYADRAVGGD